MRCLISSKRKWDLQVSFFSARTGWKGRYPSSIMRLSFADICDAPQAKAYLDPNSEPGTILSSEWWDGLLEGLSQDHSEQVSILAACCRFHGLDVTEEYSTREAIHYKSSIFHHAIAFCWDCTDPDGGLEVYADHHDDAHTEGDCYFDGLPGRRRPELDDYPLVDPRDLVPSIFLQEDLCNVARSTSNPAFIASCLFYSLETLLNLPSNTSMRDMDSLGNRFVCMRCSPYNRLTKTWKDLVSSSEMQDIFLAYMRLTKLNMAC